MPDACNHAAVCEFKIHGSVMQGSRSPIMIQLCVNFRSK